MSRVRHITFKRPIYIRRLVRLRVIALWLGLVATATGAVVLGIRERSVVPFAVLVLVAVMGGVARTGS